MSKITLHSITIEGFNSIIKPLTYQLDSQGLNLILGKNGSGKTQIFSALTWVAYGKTLKKSNRVEPWDSRKTKDYHGTKVSLYFDRDGIKYRIIRCNNYQLKVKDNTKGGSNLYLMINNSFDEKIKDKNQMKEAIKNLLGASFELFKNSIIFGQKLKRIIQEEGPKKKEIFEEAFDTMYIQRGQVIAQKELATLKGQKSKLIALEDSYTLKIQMRMKELLSARQEHKDRSSRIKTLKSKIAIKEQELAQLHRDKGRGEIYKKQLSELKDPAYKISLLSDLSAQKILKERYTNKIQDIENNRVEVGKKPKELSRRICTLCKNPITKKQANKEYQDALKSWKKYRKLWKESEDNISVTKAMLYKVEEQIHGILNQLNKYKDIEEQRKLLEGKFKKYQGTSYNIKLIKEVIQGYKSDLKVAREKVVKDLSNLQNKISKLESKREETRAEIKSIDSKISDLTWVIKDPLSNSGLKAYIFSELLRKINKKLMIYSDYLGYIIKFGIDLSSPKKDFYTKVYEGTEEKDYNDLSGGQQQLVDIAIVFSIHEVTSEGTNYNMLGLDEVFESLDEDNVEVVIGLIEMMAKNKSVHLITHLTSLRNAKAYVTRLKLDKNKTTVLA